MKNGLFSCYYARPCDGWRLCDLHLFNRCHCEHSITQICYQI